MRHTSNTNKTQAGALVELSPEVASVITKLSEFAATYAELTAEFNSYINDNQHMLLGETIECDANIDNFNDYSRQSITRILFFIENVICSAHLRSN